MSTSKSALPHRLRQRAAILRALRRFLDDEGLVEVQPPLLVPSPALEANLDAVPAGGRWLHTSPEFHLKRLVAGGLHRVYSVVPCFRAEEHGRHHRREFTLLELYVTNARYDDLIPLVTGLVAAAAHAVGVPAPVFRQVTVAELFGGTVPQDDDSFYRAWVERVDPALGNPTFVLDYPARQAALAQLRGPVAERLEVYLGGLELGNGFSELRDGAELRERFAESGRQRRSCGKEPHPVDEGLIDATARLPRCAGIAIGVDRLVMALTGVDDIAEVVVEADETP